MLRSASLLTTHNGTWSTHRSSYFKHYSVAHYIYYALLSKDRHLLNQEDYNGYNDFFRVNLIRISLQDLQWLFRQSLDNSSLPSKEDLAWISFSAFDYSASARMSLLRRTNSWRRTTYLNHCTNLAVKGGAFGTNIVIEPLKASIHIRILTFPYSF